MTKEELRKSLDFVCEERERLQRENEDLRSAITDYQEAVGDYLQELETRQYDIDNLTYQLAKKNDNWNELKKYLEYEIKEWKDVENEWGKIRTSEDENILDKIKELENAKNS